MVEDNRLQLLASIKQFRSPQDVLLTVQSSCPFRDVVCDVFVCDPCMIHYVLFRRVLGNLHTLLGLSWKVPLV